MPTCRRRSMRHGRTPARMIRLCGTRKADGSTWTRSPATLSVRRAPAGTQSALDLDAPPLVAGAVIVATFHTHPNPSAEGWDPRPSVDDTRSAWLLGVPCLIRA